MSKLPISPEGAQSVKVSLIKAAEKFTETRPTATQRKALEKMVDKHIKDTYELTK